MIVILLCSLCDGDIRYEVGLGGSYVDFECADCGSIWDRDCLPLAQVLGTTGLVAVYLPESGVSDRDAVVG